MFSLVNHKPFEMFCKWLRQTPIGSCFLGMSPNYRLVITQFHGNLFVE